ncbi:MAG TPA: DUF5107 domain-containing protein [Bacteroidales bacterium]|nr:DUF5107 domain-containing protein [Bacteroidales bacterium]
MDEEVKAWQEQVNIPTYLTGPPDKNPMFLEKRIYQGSSGAVYPYPIIEKISDQRSDVAYNALFLENNYLKIMILPRLGGRVQMAFDKIGQRHFIYYNRVIKPALVGLTGPWISGGIEFNWPQHHRPSTFEQTDYQIQANADGSKTVWVNEVERMSHMKCSTGFTLYPGKAYLEVEGRLYNRTPFPQTFLWWANPALKVNDHYQSVFPPDVHAVFDHGKRDVSGFPVANGTYYKVDYSPGTDISWYRNIPVPTSYMAVASKYDFIGGYEHDTRAGLLHVADHHISPGKKQWTWGTGDFGRAWEQNLTDEDGPYVEMMTGVFTDNQPDFSWLQPYEERSFVQYFMPYREIGIVNNANKDALLGLDISGHDVEIRLFVTSRFDGIRIRLLREEQEVFSETLSIGPEDPYVKKITMTEDFSPAAVKLTVTEMKTGRELLSYHEEIAGKTTIPAPATSPFKPADVENNEQLFLTGLHLEQYRHATCMPVDYYEEALRRDPKDAKNNNALGLWYLRRGQFARAEAFFRKAMETLTSRNPNPCDGEPFYNLGCALTFQDRYEEAFDTFYKSVWNHAWQDAGYLNLARIAVRQKNYLHALELVEKSLTGNVRSHTARHLKAVILRYLDKIPEAEEWITESLKLDPFHFGCLYERCVILQQNKARSSDDALTQLKTVSRLLVHNFLEYTLDYAHAGLYRDASDLLSVYYNENRDGYSLVPYYLGWLAYREGNHPAATEYFRQGSALRPDLVFPDRIEEILVLKTALEVDPADAKAHYYLGNLWYDKRQYEEAIGCWERSAALRDDFPTVHRNLAIAYYNKRHDPERAQTFLEKAFSLDRSDARILMELDQLYKRMNKSHEERLSQLEAHSGLVSQRDDLYLEQVTLCNQLCRFRKAKDLLASRRFHPWEGGEGKVVGQYLLCHLELAKEAIAADRPGEALDLLEQTENYPSSLGEGKLYGACENDIHYWKGIVYERMGMVDKARRCFELATKGQSQPVQALFYNDPQPDMIFYQGLAWRKSGREEKASAIFQQLIDFGEMHMNDEAMIDYFAVSLPDLLVFDADLDMRNKIHCFYMMGLGYMGKGNGSRERAEALFERVLSMDVNHQGAQVHRQMLRRGDL